MIIYESLLSGSKAVRRKKKEEYAMGARSLNFSEEIVQSIKDAAVLLMLGRCWYMFGALAG